MSPSYIQSQALKCLDEYCYCQHSSVTVYFTTWLILILIKYVHCFYEDDSFRLLILSWCLSTAKPHCLCCLNTVWFIGLNVSFSSGLALLYNMICSMLTVSQTKLTLTDRAWQCAYCTGISELFFFSFTGLNPNCLATC